MTIERMTIETRYVGRLSYMCDGCKQPVEIQGADFTVIDGKEYFRTICPRCGDKDRNRNTAVHDAYTKENIDRSNLIAEKAGRPKLEFFPLYVFTSKERL
jgi:hypothetical protein